MSEPRAESALPVWRLNAMRGGYLLMGVGLAIVKWPLLPQAQTLPLYEGVVLCMLTAMSLLALLGLRYPVKLIPLLLLESLWKLLWLGIVAVPVLASDGVGPEMRDVVVSCSLVAIIIAVTPWHHVWRTYAVARGDAWS